MRITIVLGLLLLAASARAEATPPPSPQSRWRWESPKPSGNNLFSVAGNAELICAAGEGGVILCSSDGASSWVAARPTRSTLHGIAWSGHAFVAVGERGIILRRDSGQNGWTRVDRGATPTLNAVIAANEQLIAVGDRGIVLVSRDDGRTWQREPHQNHANLQSIAAEGAWMLAVGDRGVLLESRDGGQTWRPRRLPTDEQLTAVGIRGSEVLIGGDETIVSRDRGRSWSIPRRTIPNISAIRNCGDGHILAVAAGLHRGYVGSIGKDRELGWPPAVVVPAEAGDDQFFGVWCDGALAVVVGDGGMVLRSQDRGEHWEVRTTLLERSRSLLESAWASRAGEIYVVGRAGVVLVGGASGSTWRRVTLTGAKGPVTTNLLTVWGDSKENVFIGGEGGLLFRSSDRGRTWQENPKLPQAVTGLWGSGSELIAVDRFILRSVDGGRVWQRVGAPSAKDGRFSSVWGRDDGEYFAVGHGGEIQRSRDRGNHWEAMKSGVSTILTSVRGDDRSVWVAGMRGVILRLGSGEDRWHVMRSGGDPDFFSVAAAAPDEIFAVTWPDCQILSSRDGRTWTKEDVAGAEAAREVLSVGGHIWAFGTKGAILFRE